VVKEGKSLQVTVRPQDLQEYLGILKFRDTKAEEKNEIGLATGLAWTEVGGQILTIEVTLMQGKGKLLLTGKLGEVMQESAQAAMSYVRSRASQLGLRADFYRHLDIHVHIPEGAIPKDGPSAGITLATALASALTKIAVRRDVAMTGEITLRGKVLPIGGVKEKLLAAHRAGTRTVILPRDNEKDLADLPTAIQQELSIRFVSSMDEVLDFALESKIEVQPVRASESETPVVLEPPTLETDRGSLTI
jgi:ATP-dependent Lon protease